MRVGLGAHVNWAARIGRRLLDTQLSERQTDPVRRRDQEDRAASRGRLRCRRQGREMSKHRAKISCSCVRDHVDQSPVDHERTAAAAAEQGTIGCRSSCARVRPPAAERARLRGANSTRWLRRQRTNGFQPACPRTCHHAAPPDVSGLLGRAFNSAPTVTCSPLARRSRTTSAHADGVVGHRR